MTTVVHRRTSSRGVGATAMADAVAIPYDEGRSHYGGLALTPNEESVLLPASVVPPLLYSRAISSSALEMAASGPVTMLEHQRQQHQQQQSRHSTFRSKSVAWKDPMLLLQKIGSRRVPGFFQGGSKSVRVVQRSQQQTKGSAYSPDYARPSRWARFWRKLKFDSGRKVHATRPDWLNYDSQSYAMNFEKDMESSFHQGAQQPMPKISGPGAREIVTVLLKRSSSANRNSGAILIPRPVFAAKHLERNQPLWKRRSVRAPASLDVNKNSRVLAFRRRQSRAAA